MPKMPRYRFADNPDGTRRIEPVDPEPPRWNDPAAIRRQAEYLQEQIMKAYGLPPTLVNPDAYAPDVVQDRWNELLHVMLDNQRITRDNKMIDDPRYDKEPQ